jgi:hypothetical protein
LFIHFTNVINARNMEHIKISVISLFLNDTFVKSVPRTNCSLSNVIVIDT